MFRFSFLLFLLIPLIELYFLIQVGEVIGAGWTILLVVITAAVGAYLVRLQGFQTFMRAQANLSHGQMPATEMLEGIVILISGFMLLVPGFVTDAVGFLLLIPTLRRLMIERALKNKRFRFRHTQSGFAQRHYQDDDFIEGEVVNKDDDDKHLH